MKFGAAAVRLLFRRSALASDCTGLEQCGGFGPQCSSVSWWDPASWWDGPSYTTFPRPEAPENVNPRFGYAIPTHESPSRARYAYLSNSSPIVTYKTFRQKRERVLARRAKTVKHRDRKIAEPDLPFRRARSQVA